MVINTDIRDIIVEIDGAEYPVAAKTIDVAEKLEEALPESPGARKNP